MNSKITSSGLAAMIALATGKQKQLCEDFVSVLFRIVEQELKKGENVRIKGFGTFKLVDVEPRKSVNVSTGEDYEIPGHTKVIFVMAKELSSLVNAPFEAFETVEISDALPTDSLDGEVEVSDEISEFSESSELSETSEFSELSELSEPCELSEPSELSDCSEISGNNDNLDNYAEEEVSFWKRYKFVIGFIAGACASLLIGWLAIGLADHVGLNREKDDAIADAAEERVEVVEVVDGSEGSLSDSLDIAKTHDVVDSIIDVEKEDVPTTPSDSPVYDTVSTTRYLTTIAKEHYGNFNLWPIIYEENAAILGHPDRIRPGTKVVVPPLSKYGVDPKDKEQIKAIKQKGNAIYAKYK